MSGRGHRSLLIALATFVGVWLAVMTLRRDGASDKLEATRAAPGLQATPAGNSVTTRATLSPQSAETQQDVGILVVNETHEPVDSATVISSERPVRSLEGQHVLIGTTDSSGRIPLNRVVASRGARIVSAHHHGYISAVATPDWSHFPIRLLMQGGCGLRFVCRCNGQPLERVRIRMSKIGMPVTPTLGEASDPISAPLPGSAGSSNVFTCVSDSRGTADIGGLPSGRYDYEASLSGYVLANAPPVGGITVPSNEDVTLEFVEPWVYGLALNPGEVLSWRAAPLIVAGNSFAITMANRSRPTLEARWPNAIIMLTVPFGSGRATPPHCPIKVLRPAGESVTEVAPVRLSDFAAPVMENPAKAGAVDVGEVDITFTSDGGATRIPELLAYSLGCENVLTYAAETQWPPPRTNVDGHYRLAKGTYRVSPTAWARGAFRPVTITATAGKRTVVEVAVVGRLREVKFRIAGPIGEEIGAVASCTVDEAPAAFIPNTLKQTALLPIGKLVDVAASHFGLLESRLKFYVSDGAGVQVQEVQLVGAE